MMQADASQLQPNLVIGTTLDQRNDVLNLQSCHDEFLWTQAVTATGFCCDSNALSKFFSETSPHAAFMGEIRLRSTATLMAFALRIKPRR